MYLKFPGNIAVGATKTGLILGGSANIRPRIVYYSCSCDGTPTSDTALDFQIRRASALGTSTAVTPKSNDPSDEGLTFTATGGSNCTVEPTYSGFITEDAMNPRLLTRWSPYDRADEIIIAAGAATGVGFQIQAVGGAAGSWRLNATVQQ